MAKGCVYIPKTGKDAGKVFGSKDSLAAHMNYTPAMADMMARYEKTGGNMDVASVTKWLTENGYIKAEATKPTTKKTEQGKAEPKQNETGATISKSEQAGLEILNKYGVQRFTDWLTNQPLLGDGFYGIRDIANKYGIKFPQTIKEFDAEVDKNGGIDNYMGSMADTFISKMKQPSVEKKPTVKKEFPKAPVTDVVKAALKSVDNTTAAIMNLAKVLPSVYESLVKQVKLSIGKPVSQQISEAYHNAVENGVEPGLVAAVENAVALQEQMKSKPSLSGQIETNETLEIEGVPTGTRAGNKASMDALERKHSDNATKKAVIAAVKKAARTLKSVFPSMDIHIHEDSKQYAAAMAGLNGQKNSKGNFSYTTSNDGTIVGRIDINLSNAQPSTVVHEVTHAILLKMFGDNSAAFLDFRNKIEKIISASGNKRLSDFADQYQEIADEIGQAEEYLAELGGILSDKQNPLEYGVVRRIAELINKFVSTVTFDKFQPFQDLQDQKDTLEFFNTIAQSIKAGTPIDDLMTSEPYSGYLAVEVDPDGNFVKSELKSKSAIGDYIIPKGKKDLDIASVPMKTLKEKIKEYGGRVIIITSDATGYGVDKKGREIYGGPGFANNKKNVLDEIGFASLNIGTVKSTYTAAENIYGQGKTLVLIMVQPPHTTINNSYGTRYFMEALVKIAKNKDWKEVKADIKTRISTLAIITNEIGDENVAKMMEFFDKINSKSDPDVLTQEYLNFTTFPARSVIAKTLMLEHPGKGVNVNTAKSKKAFLDIGVTIYDFLKEYGDQTILTEDMMRNDIGGYVVAGFEIDVTDKDTREKLIVETQSKGITHPLFNAKLPGTNHFVLDGLYGVNENFARFSKTNTEIALSKNERDQMVREVYPDASNYDKKIAQKINAIEADQQLTEQDKAQAVEKLKIYTNLTTARKIQFKEKHLSKIEGALVTIMPNVATSVSQGIGFIPEKGAEKRIEKANYTKFKSKAQIFGETGATRMENAEKVLGNLQVARDMEAKFEKEERTMAFVAPSKSAEDAQKIRLATGWEKGADGMWRLEIPDGRLKPIDLDNLRKHNDEIPFDDLDEIYDSKELYDAYPSARDIQVMFIESDDFKGSYNRNEKRIQLAINQFDEPVDMLSTLLHEIQHHIQYEEGFATGANTSTVVDQVKFDLYLIDKQIKTIKQEREEPGADVNKLQKEQEALEARGRKLNYQVAQLVKDLKSKLEVDLKKSEEGSTFEERTRLQLYKRAAGEVESRNVQKRMGLSEEDRVNKLLSSTEDVSRNDQLVLGAALRGETPAIKSKSSLESIEDKGGLVYHGGDIIDLNSIRENEPLFVTESESEAIAYSKGNRGDVSVASIDLSKIGDEKVARDILNKMGYSEEYMLHELIDPRFEESYIGNKDVKKLYSEIKKQGYVGISFMDTGIAKKRNVTNIFLVSPKETLAKSGFETNKIVSESRSFDLLEQGYLPVIDGKVIQNPTEEELSNYFSKNEYLNMVKPSVSSRLGIKSKAQLASSNDLVVYHGTGERSNVINALNNNSFRPFKSANVETGIFVSTNKELAQKYAEITEGKDIGVVELKFDKKPKIKKFSSPKEEYEFEKSYSSNPSEAARLFKQDMLSKGYDGIQSSPDIILIFNEKINILKDNTGLEIKSKAQLADGNAKKVADLYAEMREGGGWAERQKINAILDGDPKLSYIYHNFREITQMLEDAQLLTKSGNCP